MKHSCVLKVYLFLLPVIFIFAIQAFSSSTNFNANRYDHQDKTKAVVSPNSANVSKPSTLVVKPLNFKQFKPTIEEVERAMEKTKLPFETLEYVNWVKFPYKPQTKFRMAYNKQEIYLQFNVTESAILAQEVDEEKGMPCFDSCVEFFVKIPGDSTYYNLEFNCIGTCLVENGIRSNNRIRLSKELTSKIRRKSSLGSTSFAEKKGNFNWTLTLAIPLEVFGTSNITTLKKQTLQANFYKCGEKLSTKHYVSWSPILTKWPNFHKPEFFGVLYFK